MPDYFIDDLLKKKKKKQENNDITIDSLLKKKTGDTSKAKQNVRDSGDGKILKAGSFDDGFQWHDLITTPIATGTDIIVGAAKGALQFGEGITDSVLYGVSDVADLIGANKFAKKTKKIADVNDTQDWYDSVKDDFVYDSLLGQDARGVTEGLGQVGAMLGIGAIGGAAGLGAKGVSALTTGSTFASSAGSGRSEAYQSGATDEEAIKYGLMQGGIDAGTELMFGGLGKGVNALGISKGISSADDMLAGALTKKMKNQTLKNITQGVVKGAGEGVEELVAGYLGAHAQKDTFRSEDDFKDIVKDQQLGKQFLTGMAVGDIAQARSVIGASKQGTDYVTGYTQNEQKVIDTLVEQKVKETEKNNKKLSVKEKNKIKTEVETLLKRGEIDIDTIERTLGGKTYDSYRSLSQEMEEYQSLNKMKAMELTGEQSDRLAELKEKNKKASYESEQARLKEQLSKEVSDMTVNDRFLRESYNEKGRRSQAFETDVNTYDEKQRSVIQNAIDSGILNNTRRTHEFVDMIAKISADKGVSFDFTDNQRLKESGFAKEGVSVNGYIKDGNVTINVNSAKALNKVVGHEITHVLEGSDLYAELQEAVKAYATTKGEYNTKLEAITKLYEGVEGANVEQELTADLIGEYLFTDEAFVQQLSAQNRNVFQKIYDEIKYLCKVVTAGSKEAKQLEKVKKVFDEAYRDSSKTKTKDSIQYSIEKFANDFDAWDKKNPTKVFDVAVTSDALKSIGIEDKSITMDSSKLIKTMSKHKGMTEDVIKKIPNIVNDPMLILESKKSSSRIVLLGEVVDSNGKTVVAILELNPTNRKGAVLDEIKIASAYGKDNLQTFINTSKILYKNSDNTKTSSWLTSTGLQLPVESITTGSTDSITQSTKNATNNQKLSLGDDIAPAGKWNVKGSDITLDDSTPIRKDIAPAQNQETSEEQNPYEPDDLTDGPFTMDEKAITSEDEETIQFREANKRKVENIQAKIQGLQVSKDVTEKEFNDSIAKKKEEYEGLKRKDTARASKLLEQITNLEYRRDNTLAELDRKIEGQRKAMDNIKKQEVARQRKRKQNELQNRVRELIGDTSTWKDKKNGISYQVNTLRRNLRDVVRDADENRDIAKADEIYDALQGKYNINEAELNREANRIKKEFADLKINAAENAYIQMLGEYRHNPDTTISAEVIGEYYEKHKSKIDNAKVDKAIETARKLYDSLFYRVNSVLREQGMQEIGYREGYFPHFTEEKQSVLGKIFNWKTQNNDIPTDIAGLTEQFNPNRSWQSFNKHRTGDDTDYNFMKGLDNYINGALDWIYHIEDIQMRRAFENEIRYRHSEKGIQDKIDVIYSNPFYDADEAQAEIDKILKEAKNPLNNFVTDLRKGTNVLAGKKDSGDRYIEEKTSRKIYSTMTNISNRVTANMVAGSVSSALTNFIPITQSWGQVSPVSSVIGMAETIKSYVADDGTVDKSNFLTNRLRQNSNLYQTGWDKAGNAVGFMMEAIDNFTSQTVWRSKYMENIKNGMSEEAAIKDADQFAENVIAGRSRGNMPTIFNEKNLITKMFTAFQLEVGNQYGYMLKDMPQDMRNESKGKLVKGYVSMFVGAYVYNALFSKLTGRDAAFDPFRILQELLGDLFGDDEEEGSITKAITNLATNVVEETPFIGGLVGGGRIPISSALPYEGLSVETLTGVMNDLSEGNMKNFWQEILKPVYYVAMPMGGGQTRKTIQGLQMFDDDLPIAGSYTNSGKLRFSVDDDIPTRIQAAVFGQYANENAREYFDEGRSPLNEKKTKELVDLDIPISEYWDIQDGLKEHEKLADKIDYVAGLDLPVAKKNILANNLTDRKEPIDLTDYDLYENIEELDFATNNPDKYKVAKAVGGYSSYKTYTEALNGIKANKDKNGKTVSGSRKTKVVNYLNGLSADYGTKLILFKQQFKGDDTYNKEIVEYLNKRNDLSYSDVETILKELGFEVDSNGNVRW